MIDGVEIGQANHKDHREDGTNDTQKIPTDGVTVVKFGKVENLENTGTPNSAMDEGNLCKLIIKGLAMQDCTTVASVKKKERQIQCYDDITGKDLALNAVLQVREQELEYLRKWRAHEHVDARNSKPKTQKYVQSTPSGSIHTKRSRKSRCRSDRVGRVNSGVEINEICWDRAKDGTFLADFASVEGDQTDPARESRCRRGKHEGRACRDEEHQKCRAEELLAIL